MFRFLYPCLLVCGLAVAGTVAHAQDLPSDPLAPRAGLSTDMRQAYEEGRLIFNGHWRPSGTNGPDDLVGLGPLYNRLSCASCHGAGGRGKPPEGPDSPFLTALVRIGVVDAEGKVSPHPVFGTQIQDRAIPDIEPEATLSLEWEPVSGQFPDGTDYELRRPVLTIAPDPGPAARWSIRVAPQVYGVGALAEAVGPQFTPGVFGWKALEPTLVTQNAAALSQDIGITSLYRPDPICPAAGCEVGKPEIDGARLMLLTLFTDQLAAPEPDAPPALGKMLFTKIGCARCHRPDLPKQIGSGMVHAYTDLALHDMGPGLDDGLPEGGVDSAKWRTAPLWGLGKVLKKDPAFPLLHDGRARGAVEAILWHDGSAAGARKGFMALSKEDRDALIAFLASL